MKYLLDLHTHTIASGHAYSTVKENVDFAREIGLELLGISEHAPEMPYSTNDYYFMNLGVIPREIGGLRLLKGAELNIMDADGTLDLTERQLERLDYAIASLHPPCIRPGSVDENTAALINSIKNPYVGIIGHPCDPRYPFDIKAVVAAAGENAVMLEINNASYDPHSGRRGGEQMTIDMLKECKKQGVPVILGSDAHFYSLIGDFSRTEPLLEQAAFPHELIMNLSVEKTLEALGIC